MVYLGFLIGTMMDPIMIFGCLLIGGIFEKSYSKVIIYAIAFAIVIEIWVYFINVNSMGYNYLFLLPYRLIGTIIVSSIFFALTKKFILKEK